ncbi:MAG: ATP-binding cassette domain-containing protein, partial [Thermocrispum sp.]
LRLRAVRAAWTPDGPTAVGPLDLDLPPWHRLGVVGPSGSGKSTLVAVLTRALDPRTGCVTLDGVDLRDLPLDDVRGVVGVVDDDPHLFGTTLAENVRFARPGADDAAVALALRDARLGEWVESLPDGLNTRLGDGGSAVSGGERARIALARVLLANRPVVVLDEPTAHLDTDTAEAVLGDLLAATTGRTVVLVGHRTEAFGRLDAVLDLSPPEHAAMDIWGLGEAPLRAVL